MQQLQFEASWDKALAAEDRQKIEGIFKNTSHLHKNGILFSPIQEAVNYKGQLLVTVIVHNGTDEVLQFNKRKLRYQKDDVVISEGEFTLPALVIPPKVSMPWTFIFPKVSFSTGDSFKCGKLIMDIKNEANLN